MTKRNDLLLEIGTEELPPGEIVALAEALAQGLHAALADNRLLADDASTQSFAAPRRISARITGVAARQGAQTIVRKGPALAAAFAKDGSPTGAAHGLGGVRRFLCVAGCGVDGAAR